METGLLGIHKEDQEKKCEIYVEEYVLAYLKKEVDTLELSEIFFYGRRENCGRKIFIYGAGREKEIAAFAEYELLTELVCRLTQAGPVFMVRSADGTCKATSFQVFYENNEAMQSFLIGWTGSEGQGRTAERNSKREMNAIPAENETEEKKRRTVHGAISVQLSLILLVLIAIVVSSTDSYDKMKQLGQSAKEVFFAIENQETEEVAKNPGEQTEIVVEREMTAEAQDDKEETVAAGDAKKQQGTDTAEEETLETDEDRVEKTQEEGILEPVDAKPEESVEDAGEEKESEDSVPDPAEESVPESTEESQDGEMQDNEDNTEALSRSITRYYEVERGDTLYTISQEIYGDFSQVEKICEMNQISDPDRIRYGQKIILP